MAETGQWSPSGVAGAVSSILVALSVVTTPGEVSSSQLLVLLVGTDIFTTNNRERGTGCWDKLLYNYHNEMMLELRGAADTIFFLPTLLIYKNRETVTEITSLSNRISRWVTYVCISK